VIPSLRSLGLEDLGSSVRRPEMPSGDLAIIKIWRNPPQTTKKDQGSTKFISPLKLQTHKPMPSFKNKKQVSKSIKKRKTPEPLEIMQEVFKALKSSFKIPGEVEDFENWRLRVGRDDGDEPIYIIYFPEKWFSYIYDDGDETVLYKVEFSNVNKKRKTLDATLCGNPKYVGCGVGEEKEDYDIKLSVKAIKQWVMNKIAMRTEAQHAKGEGYYY
jgi:hypothetical protein